MEHIDCPFHPGADSQLAIEENGYQGRRCAVCGLIYISPRPAPGEIDNLYAHDLSHKKAKLQIRPSIYKTLHARHNLRILSRYRARGRLLELGSGGGHFLAEARRFGFRPHGIELGRIQAEHISKRLEIPCESRPLEPHSFRGRQFNVIYHCDVLSHLPDPVATHRDLAARLKPGGYLMLETGNLADLPPERYGIYPRFQYPDHLFFFGEKTLRLLFEAVGLESLRFYRWSIHPHLWLMRRAPELRGRGFQRVEYLFRYPLGRLDAWRAGRALTLLALARKPQ